jgi:hypothetical protein
MRLARRSISALASSACTRHVYPLLRCISQWADSSVLFNLPSGILAKRRMMQRRGRSLRRSATAARFLPASLPGRGDLDLSG